MLFRGAFVLHPVFTPFIMERSFEENSLLNRNEIF